MNMQTAANKSNRHQIHYYTKKTRVYPVYVINYP